MNSDTPVQLVGIVGGSGAGKGWLVQRLCQLLGDKACHLQLDDFYRDRSHLPLARRVQLNFDIPGAIDWEWTAKALRACRAGERTSLPCYDFSTFSRKAPRTEWAPRPIVFVDGLWLLRPPVIRALFDLKLYLDTPAEVRRNRRLARDVAERGYTRELVERQLESVLPMHERYVEPQKRWADLVLAQPFREEQLVELADRLWAILERAEVVAQWEHDTFRSDLIGLLSNHEYCT